VASVLIVDEPTPERQGLVELLTAAGHVITVVESAAEGLTRWRAQKHELAVLDLRAGTELAGRMKAETPHVYAPVLMIVDRPDPVARIEALSLADDALSRPYLPAEAHARCEALLRTRGLVDGLRAARAESEARSTADPVTNLRNRVFLGERLNEEYKRAVRYNEPLSMLLLSVEGLRELIASRGPGFGDRLMISVAQAALRSLRQIDVVVRYSASELAALLPNTHFAGSLICAERLLKESGRPVDDYVPKVTMGISFYPGKDVGEPADLIRIATRALDTARQEGPGRICLVQHQGYLYQPK
jgi:diguanylate cyclase (GGDEF)-like protein